MLYDLHPQALLLLAPIAGAVSPWLGASPRPPQSATVRMEQQVLQDELLQGLGAQQVLVPEGWTLGGGILWQPWITWAFVHVDAAVSAPDGREVRFFPSCDFTFSASNHGQGAQFSPGQVAGGKVFMAPGEGPADFVTDILLPVYRPHATEVRVQRVTEAKALGDFYRGMFANQIAEFSQLLRGGGMQGSMRVEAPIVLVEYTAGGQRFEEQISFLYRRSEVHVQHGMGMQTETYDWAVYYVRSLRAPSGRLDEELPLLHTIADSLRPTRRWQGIVDELMRRVVRNQSERSRMEHESNMESLRRLAESGRRVARMNSEIMDKSQASWRRTQETQDHMSRAWTNTMHGVDDFKMPDGTTRSLDSSYDRVFTTDGTEFLFTNDALSEPNIGSTVEWHEVKPVR